MVKNVKINAKTRSKLSAKQLRALGGLPAVIYGSGSKPQNLEIKQKDFNKLFGVVGESQLIDVIIDGQNSVKAVIKDVQRDRIKGNIIHADLYEVDMNKKIEIEIPLKFTGEAKAVKELGGTLVKNFETISAKSLPGDLIDSIEVDISVLEGFGDSIKVKDLKVPKNIELLAQENDLVAHVLEQQIEEEEKPATEELGDKTAEEKKKEGKKEEGEKKSEKEQSKNEKEK